MKVIHLNNADKAGGAAIASYRIHQSLLKEGLDSYLWVNNAESGHWSVKGPEGKINKAIALARRHLATPILKTFNTDNKILHSPAIIPSLWHKKINSNDADIINLHWVGAEMMSISDIGKIKKPKIWTLHDMWSFCGAEHISWDNRWQSGYLKKNRPGHETGFDINRWSWKRKLKHWQEPYHIVAVSEWLANCARNSVIMKDWPITVIPNCIDTEFWRPVEKNLAREILGLPKDVTIISFGTYGANAEYHKGYDLLLNALKRLDNKSKNIQLAIFGQAAPREHPNLGYEINFMGHFHDSLSLKVFYSAIDLLIVPSRMEAFGQTAIESMACETPVVAFGATGLLDIVDHKTSGYLAEPYEADDLANGINYVLSSSSYSQFCTNARKKILDKFKSNIVAKKYKDLYGNILKSKVI